MMPAPLARCARCSVPLVLVLRPAVRCYADAVRAYGDPSWRSLTARCPACDDAIDALEPARR